MANWHLRQRPEEEAPVTARDLSEAEVDRYSRHILLKEVGGAGQRKLLASSAFVVGAGGLGSAALLYLAAAGVGRLGIADGDRVEPSNLQRQIAHRTADIGRPKVRSAADAILALNPGCAVETFEERLNAASIGRIVRGYDVILDGSDNFGTRFLVADFCRLEGIPLVSAAAVGFEGQLLTVLPEKGLSCYRCMIPEPPSADAAPSCRSAGVFGPAVGVMGVLQALEALKLLLGVGDGFARRLLVFDALAGSFRTINRAADPDCPLCGQRPTITGLVEYAAPSCPRSTS